MKLTSFFNIKGLIGAGAIGLATGFASGMTIQGVLKDGKIYKCAAELERTKNAPLTAEVEERSRVAPISEAATASAATAKAEVRWRTRRIVERVRDEVPDDGSRRLISGGDIVPLAAISLLDEAATGVSPEAVTAGVTPERADPLTFTRLTAEVADNYGIANSNAADHRALVEWEKAVGMAPKPGL